MLALCPTRLLTPAGFETGRCVMIEDGHIIGTPQLSDCAGSVSLEHLDGDLVPGFIDLQVNGGGGILFNEEPTVEGIAAIGRAHRRFGTTGFLPTVISDDLDVVDRAMRAVESAIARRVPGVLGIHVEGPFSNTAKRDIHDAGKTRQIDGSAVELLTSLDRGITLVTLAPELAPPGTIETLVQAGVVVSAGHSAASYEEVCRALDEGLTGFTHLFNGMTQLHSRAPGVVGAALDSEDSWCGIILDGFHVHPASLRIALAAKGPERLVLVTDAMPTVGSERKIFMLGDRHICESQGWCTAEDGTLAGSALDMASAVRNAIDTLAVELGAALKMASRNPARAVALEDVTGAIRPGLRADLVLLDPDVHVLRSWIYGECESA
ncbi:MAG: N-acetylglucosamine-6-phosphate deacetylase [Sphingomicrobium sp.]